MPLFLFLGLGSFSNLQWLFWNQCQVNNTIKSLTKWQSMNVCFIWPMVCFNDNTLLLLYDFLCSLFLIECETLLNKNISTKVILLTLFFWVPLLLIYGHVLWCFWFVIMNYNFFWVVICLNYTTWFSHITKITSFKNHFSPLCEKKTCSLPNAKNKPLSFTISFFPFGKWIRVWSSKKFILCIFSKDTNEKFISFIFWVQNYVM